MLGTILADACLLAGAFDEGLATLAPMLAVAGDRGPLLYLAEQCRLEGELLLGSGRADDDAVEGWFQRALSVARGQQARSFELRIAMSLARLWRRQGKPAEARALLAPIYGWFTEGLETPDLRAAAALLEQ
jgi:predicted ATPase